VSWRVSRSVQGGHLELKPMERSPSQPTGFQNVTQIDKKCNPNRQKGCQNRTENNTRIIENIPCEKKRKIELK
jgi:hypothetical protein